MTLKADQRHKPGRGAAWLFVVLGLMLVLAQGASATTCAPGTVYLRGPWGQAQFSVEIAETPKTRALGLMNRPYLAPDAGMLFVYPAPRRVAFWMKNTLIPLDMLFVDQRGVVVRIAQNARPLDETPIPGGNDIKAVLEINGGLVRALGLTVGSALRHPAFGQGAAWPCAAP